MDRLRQLEASLALTLIRDRSRLDHRLRQLRRVKPGERFEQQIARLQQDVAASARIRQQRIDGLPRPRFDQPLPILEKRTEIAEALLQRQTIIVAGETGSGKSTQLPQIALAAGFGTEAMIGHTQPRRIAAQAIASRVAEELGTGLGEQVGYKIRFADRTNPRTYVKLMTDGILLAETQSDRDLNQYQLIILDEAHERSLNIDFLIGYLRQLLPRRPDLQLVITSATIDAERFSQHFADAQGPAPIIEVSGRTYPVEVRYRPLQQDEEDETPVSDAIVAAIHEVAAIDRGDILVFLPTERDIRETAKRLRAETLPGDGPRRTEILPLYARLSAAEQNRIFQVSDYRRIVLATNVAESSLTVPNVRYVVDTGTARISRYAPRSKVQRLPIEAVSRASADQRKGRCGRIAPGICIRLYSEEDYLRRDAYTTPEIRRTNLASVILQAKALQLGEVAQIPFLDPPHPEAIRDGYKTLFEIGAVDHHQELTDIGKKLARMPVDPRIGRMILAAQQESCLHEVLVIAAALEIQDPRERPHDKQQQADERHAVFLDPDSDFVSYLKLWDFYHHLRQSVSRNQLRKACQQNFLSYNRLREWTEIHRQLLECVPLPPARLPTTERFSRERGRLGSRPTRRPGSASRHGRERRGPQSSSLMRSVESTKRSTGSAIDSELFAAIHRALLSGLLSGVAHRSNERDYKGAGGLQLGLWPGSGLYSSRPQWIMAAELVETSRRYARTVARISPQWIEPLAEHLVRRSYSDPRWHRKRRAVMALEKVSLLGMPIVVGRPVPYRLIDPAATRELFIQGALVEQQVETRAQFFGQNRKLREELAELAARTRRRDYLLDDYSFYQFYDQRIPAEVCDWADLERWLKRGGAAADKTLQMSLEDFVADSEQERRLHDFPEQLQIGSLQLPVSYHFEHGSDDDGVTISLPAQALGQLSPNALGWLVPGLLEEKVIALIRSLPKDLRRNFVPVPDTAREMLRQMTFGDGSLLESLASHLSRKASEPIAPSDFDATKLPEHLRMNVRVIDESGQAVRASRDLDSLRQHLSDTPRGEREGIQETTWTRDGIVSWDFGDLPAEVTIQRGGIEMRAYPAITDQQTAVGLRLFSSQSFAQQQHRRGLTRLFAMTVRKSLKAQVRWLPQWNEACVWAASVLPPEPLKAQVQELIASRALASSGSLPRREADYEAFVRESVERVAVATQEVAPLIPRLFQAYHQARLAVETLQAARWQEARQDVEQQLRHLLLDGFLTETPWNWLQQFPRFLAAIPLRVEKLTTGGETRDRDGRQLVADYWSRYETQKSKNDRLEEWDPELEEYRWMIEELRVSWFAQALGTSIKISPQRLDKQWMKVKKT